MRSPADAEAFRHELKSIASDLGRAAQEMGTVHYFRFIQFDRKTFYLIAEYDGALEEVLSGIAAHFGPAIDALMVHLRDTPSTPLAHNIEAFVTWAKPLCLESFTKYEGYPGVPAARIRSLASDAGIEFGEGTAPQLPLLIVMPMKSRVSTEAVRLAFHALNQKLMDGTDSVGTVHFARLVEFSKTEVGFFTVYDGPIEKYGQDFARTLGSAFDLLFKFIDDPPPTPTSKHAAEFTRWAQDIDLVPIAFWSAYPGLSMQDVKALLADASAGG